ILNPLAPKPMPLPGTTVNLFPETLVTSFFCNIPVVISHSYVTFR
ncbi:hypothetical protein LCGC14_2081660, partial [marine sediment metagenome]